MADNTPPELLITLFGGFEVRINGVLVPGFHNRSADKLLTLILFWDFVFDESKFKECGFEPNRAAPYAELRKWFSPNFNQSLMTLRELLGELETRVSKEFGKSYTRLDVLPHEVDAIAFFEGVRNRNISLLIEMISKYQPLLPDTWIANAERLKQSKSSEIKGSKPLNKEDNKEWWIIDLRELFHGIYLDALELLIKCEDESVSAAKRSEFYQDFVTNAPNDPRVKGLSQALLSASQEQTRNDFNNSNSASDKLSTNSQDDSIKKQITINPMVNELGSTESNCYRDKGNDAALHEQFELIYNLAKNANDALNGSGHVAAMNSLSAKRDEIQAVFKWCLEEPLYHRQALMLADCLWQYWYIRGPWRDARKWLEKVLTLPQNEEATNERASVLNALAVFALAKLDTPVAGRCLTESLELSKKLNNKDLEGGAYNSLGWHASLSENNDPMAIKRYYEQSLEAFRQAGNNAACLWPIRGIGICYKNMSDDDQALEYFKKARNLAKQTENSRGMAFVCGDFADIKKREHDYNGAYIEYCSSLRLWDHVEEMHSFASCVEEIANLADRITRPEKAVILYGVAETIRKEIEIPPWGHRFSEIREEHAKLKKLLLGKQYDAAWSEGEKMANDTAQIIQFVDHLCDMEKSF